ncbi:MAG: hypothetical protein GTN78_24445 [Gemmatimonadales bacterium]|nr:hypothetical protein [Gemmatimonadales bacterium]NIN12077.1 hypothetical protein [Gemmatimonadales bacterium]NIR03312.1 hypothetical protein [Gemmatimonadales bacterium]NIS66992.1 hypothetical protein [Gemmatimonadales bacterium]
MRTTPILLLHLLSGAGPLIAQAQLSGFVEYDNITYLKKGNAAKINSRNQGILQLELRHRASGVAEAFGSVEIRADQADPARNRVFLDEAYISLYIGDADIRVGKQIYAWGRADALNPTDNLTVWDFSDILDTDDEKIGALSARVEYYFGDWMVEGVLVPSFTASVLPGVDSRWWPELPATIPNPAYPRLGGPTLAASYTSAESVLPDEGVESTQYAVRLSGLATGWDFSISWFDGFDDLPAIHTSTVIDSTTATAEIVLQQRYHRRRAIGMDFATTMGRLGVRGEAAYYLTEDWRGVDPAIDDPYLQYTLGLDYTFSDVWPDKDLFVLVEWVQEVQVPNRNTVTGGITDLNHVFRKSLFGKVDLSFGEFTKLTLEGVVNLDSEDWWVRPGFQWSVTDGVQVKAEADLLGGPEDSFFGLFRDNRRLHLRLKYSF